MEQNKQRNIPALVEDWTWDTVVQVVQKHEFEPSLYDFKDALHPTGDQAHRDRHIDSIRRTACSMANTGGGFLLFGIQDRKKSVSSLEERIKGISVQGDLRKELGEKIIPLQPDVYFDAVLIRLPHEETRGVFVVHIPQSPRRPHMVSSTGIYYRRGEGGHAVGMNHYEIREQMMNTEERLRKVLLLRLEIHQYLSLIQTMLDAGGLVVRMLYRFDTSSFKLLLADTCSLFPTADNLLSLLLRIPQQATMINNHLERTSHPSQPAPMNVSPEYYQADVEGIRTNLSNFRDYCTFCQNRLSGLFGPLETGGPVTANEMEIYGPPA